jgi:hypothetical protein
MILLKSYESNKNVAQILEKYEKTNNFGYFRCPICQSDEFTRWGFYERSAYYIDNIIKYKVIKIQRVRCIHCKHTHALLPEPIVPYKQFCLDTIIYALTDDELTYQLKMSQDTINKYFYQFKKKFYYFLCTMLKMKNIYQIFIYIKNNLFEVYEQFYEIYLKILMMTHSGIYNMAYF